MITGLATETYSSLSLVVTQVPVTTPLTGEDRTGIRRRSCEGLGTTCSTDGKTDVLWRSTG